MDGNQLAFRDHGIALILAALGAAIGQEVLGGSRNMFRAERAAADEITLQPFHHRPRIDGDEGGVRRIAFIGAAPARVLRHGKRGREGPFDTAARDFGCSSCADAANHRRIMRRAEPDIVRKDGGAGDVVMAVNGIDAEDDRNRDAIGRRPFRDIAEGPHQLVPVSRARALIAIGATIAARQDRTERIGGEIFGFDGADIGLHQLADLLLQAHPRDQRVDRALGSRIGDRSRTMRFGPAFRMGGGVCRQGNARSGAGHGRGHGAGRCCRQQQGGGPSQVHYSPLLLRPLGAGLVRLKRQALRGISSAVARSTRARSDRPKRGSLPPALHRCASWR